MYDDSGLSLIDVIIVILDYLSWYFYPMEQIKTLLIDWSTHIWHYTPIIWF